MIVKDIWTEQDFKQMGWHDSHVYAINFPNEDLEFCLDIDYLFKWVLDDKTNLYKFWISPCELIFFNVSILKISIEFQNTIGLDILDINMQKSCLSFDKQKKIWNFEIITDKGNIKFEASGYKQIVKRQPILSQNQILGR